MTYLIDRQALYERAATLEAQALDYVGKLIERDGDETSTEWRIWSAILTERTAFKHDVYDAPSVDAIEVVRCKDCKYYAPIENDYGICEDISGLGRWWKPDDYCSYGERNDD